MPLHISGVSLSVAQRRQSTERPRGRRGTTRSERAVVAHRYWGRRVSSSRPRAASDWQSHPGAPHRRRACGRDLGAARRRPPRTHAAVTTVRSSSSVADRDGLSATATATEIATNFAGGRSYAVSRDGGSVAVSLSY